MRERNLLKRLGTHPMTLFTRSEIASDLDLMKTGEPAQFEINKYIIEELDERGASRTLTERRQALSLFETEAGGFTHISCSKSVLTSLKAATEEEEKLDRIIE